MTDQPQVLDREEVERELKTSTDEYNENAQKLVEVESRLNAETRECFAALRSLYEKRKFSNPVSSSLFELDEKYAKKEESMRLLEKEHYDLMQVCFRLLQKINAQQFNYLTASIRTLQKENAELKQSVDTRPNNLA